MNVLFDINVTSGNDEFVIFVERRSTLFKKIWPSEVSLQSKSKFIRRYSS